MSEEIEFEFKLNGKRYDSENFKIYTIDVDTTRHPYVKPNGRGEFIIKGDIQELNFDILYKAEAEVEMDKTYGIQYKILKIKREKPTDLSSSKSFLSEILTERQVETLLSVYPDIIDRVIKDVDVDLSKLSGIKEFTFNKIKTKIVENFVLIELVEKFGGVLSFQIMKKLYSEYTSSELVEKALIQNPYGCLCSLSRIGFKTADGMILELEKSGMIGQKDESILNSKFRMKSAIQFVLEENELSGSTKMPLTELRKSCGDITPECINYFLDIIKAFKDKDFYLDKSDKSIGLYKTYQIESYIEMVCKNLLMNSKDWGISVNKYKTYEGITLTDEQMLCLSNVNKHNISILTAPAGAGKSQTMSNLVNMLEDNNKTYMMCTPTGKSADVLANFTKRDVGTIHRMLGYNPVDGWSFDENNKLDVDSIIVDEATMSDIWLTKHLLEAIDVTRTKLILVFDNYQLPSVAAGNVAHDLLVSGVIPIARLTKIFRYNEGGLMQVATKIRESEQFLENSFTGNKILGAKKDFIYMEMMQIKIKEKLIKVYKKLLKDGYSIEDILIVVSQKKGDYGTKEINKYIQTLVQGEGNHKFVSKGEVKLFKGDKVVQTINNYKANTIDGGVASIFNGNTGVIEDIKNGDIIVNFGNDKVFVYSSDSIEQLDLAYCTTLHKSQGSSCKQVIVIAPKAHNFMLNSNLLYVGVTRATERVWVLGNIITINRAIKKKENFSRTTYLSSLIKNIEVK